MEIVGRIKLVGAVQEISASFKKRELVITTEEQYPQHILVEFVQDRTQLLDNYQPGEMVKVSINLRGREWVSPQGETKFFNSIHGWRIERPTMQQPAPPAYQQPAQTQAQPQTSFPPAQSAPADNEPDDLPF